MLLSNLVSTVNFKVKKKLELKAELTLAAAIIQHPNDYCRCFAPNSKYYLWV